MHHLIAEQADSQFPIHGRKKNQFIIFYFRIKSISGDYSLSLLTSQTGNAIQDGKEKKNRVKISKKKYPNIMQKILSSPKMSNFYPKFDTFNLLVSTTWKMSITETFYVVFLSIIFCNFIFYRGKISFKWNLGSWYFETSLTKFPNTKKKKLKMKSRF